MRFCCVSNTECLDGHEVSDTLGKETCDGCFDELPTPTSIAWAVKRAPHDGKIVLASLECNTRHNWAVRRSSAVSSRSPGSSRHNRSPRGWACQGTMTTVQEGASSHKIVLCHNPLFDWAASAVHCWLRGRVVSGSSTVDRGTAHFPQEPAGASSLILNGQGNPVTVIPVQVAQEPLPGEVPSPRPQSQEPMRPPRVKQALPYSVPTLAIGDVFLACNTVVGLEHAEDWDLSTLSSGLFRGSLNACGSRTDVGAGAEGTAASTSQQPHGAPRRYLLDPASEMLLRMSSLTGGQRLMFVSKESAELVRRALLLSRYDEIMAERRTAAGEVSAGEATGDAVATTSSAAVTDGCLPRINRDVPDSGPKGGWASVDGRGDDEATRSGFAPWIRRSRGDRVPTHASPPVPASALPATSTKPDLISPADVALLNTNSAVSSGESGHGNDSDSGRNSAANGGGSGHGGSTQDILQLDLPDWIPIPMREAATVAVSGVGAWVVQSFSSGGNGTVGGIQQSLAAVFRRGVAGNGGSGGSVLDVSTGPRPRLPSSPLTGPMRLPPLPAAGDREEEQPLEQPKGNGGRPGAAVPGRSGQADVECGGAPKLASSDRPSWDSEVVFQELKQLEEEKVIADAEALLRAEKRGAAGSGSGGESDCGFLPPFSFSSYVARLPVEAALKALLSTHTPTATAPAAAAAEAEATAPVPSGTAATESTGVPVRRRFLLVPDSVDELAVEGSREVDRLVAEIEAAAAAAAEEEAKPVGNDAFAEGGAGFRSVRTIASTVERTANVRRAAPRPRVALNLYDSDASHWVLDVVDELEQEGSEVASGGSSSGSSGHSQQLSLPAERFIRGTPSGPSDDLGGLVQLPAPVEPTSSGLHDTRTLAVTPRTAAATCASPSHSTAATAATASAGTSSDGSRTSSSGGAGGRTPVFVLPGVTISVRAADGSLLRLRPAFLSLQQLAAALTLVRDAAAAAWRRQRSIARWRVVSALDVLTVHSAGFPIIRFPPPSSLMGGGVSTGGAGGAGGDEDSDDGIPEAKELLREMGAGNRRPSVIDAAAASAHSQEAPSGVLGVLSTLAVGVVSFSAWCLVSAVDVWEDIYSRSHWGLEEIGVPQHVNVRPTYLEEHVRRLAEANVPAVAVAAAAARSKAAQRVQEKRARRRQTQAQRLASTQEHQHQHQQAISKTTVAEQQTKREPLPSDNSGGGNGNAAPNHQTSESETNRAAGVLSLSNLRAGDALSEGSGSSAVSAAAAGSEDSGSPVPAKGHRNRQHQRGAPAAPAAAPATTATATAAGAHTAFSGLKLQTETMAGLTILFQFVWAAASAAHSRARREADGIFISESGGGAVDGLLRLVGGRSSRDGGLSAGSGGGGGLTLTASQEGELALMAKLDIRPVASGTLPRTAAAAGVVTGASGGTAGSVDSGAAGTTATSGQQSGSVVAASGAGAPMAAEAQPWQTQLPHQQQQQEQSTVSPSSAVEATTKPAPAAAAGSPKPEGLSIRELEPMGQSGLRYELLQSSARLASQVTRSHKFEVGFHLNLRKLLGDVPEDAPDQLLKLQQPAGPVPSGAGGAVAPAAAAAAAAGRRNPSQGQAPSPEAHGLLLIGDLGLEEFEGGSGIRPLSLGYADLGELLPRPGYGMHLGLSSLSAAAALATEFGAGYLVGSSEDYSSSEDGSGSSGVHRGKVVAFRNGSGEAATGVGSRGWAAGGRGVWGRWGR